MQLPDLPVAAALDDVAAALTEREAAVLVAPPGAGKTTIVPLALLDAGWLAGNRIVMLEPRRLAARAAARRMAALRHEQVGATVGYRIRHDTRVGAATRIEVVTEGVLTRMLQNDPALAGVGLVIFDEFHERSLNADLGLALALHARRLLRADLRLMVMSATLDAAPVARLLGAGEPAPIIECEGRAYPVETRHAARSPGERPEAAVTAQTRRALAEHDGDVLVFLPGYGEIRRTAEQLERAALPDNVDVYPLFGDLPGEQQDRAIAPSPAGRRKVVLATAIAQTSLTIEGVRVVVDSGLMRVPRFDPGTGMTGLQTLRVTADVADQRRGRAGRTAPGVCYRLWSAAEERGLLPQSRAEILDADLAPLVLELACWGATLDELDWLDSPPAAGIEQARALLRQLGALGADGGITAHGRSQAALALHPRLAHMLLRAGEEDLGGLACAVAALIGERDPLRRDDGIADADLRLRLEALRRAPKGGTVAGHTIHRGRLERVRREARALARALSLRGDPRIEAADIEHAGELLALAYPDRVARRRDGASDGPRAAAAARDTRYLLRNGRGGLLPGGQSLAASEWIVACDVADGGAEARIYRAAPLQGERVEELFADDIEEVDEVTWDAAAARVRAARRRCLGALTVSEAPLADAAPERVRAALLDGVRSAGLTALPWSKATTQLRERLQFMHHADPESWPDVSDETLRDTLPEWLGPFVDGMRRLDELARLDLTQILWTRAGWHHKPELDALAPTHLEVPSGSRIPLDYADPEAPVLAVRLQEVFGLTETPRIGGGRVPVTLHLLSPAQRPVQVTSDLASFWRDAYFDVKKELKGRYPKHYWPDDPLTAQPTRRVRPKEKEPT